MSDIQEEMKRLYKRAEENDIKIIEPSEEECFVGIIKEYQRKVDELQDRIDKAVEYINEHIKDDELPRDYEYKLRSILKGEENEDNK